MAGLPSFKLENVCNGKKSRVEVNFTIPSNNKEFDCACKQDNEINSYRRVDPNKKSSHGGFDVGSFDEEISISGSDSESDCRTEMTRPGVQPKLVFQNNLPSGKAVMTYKLYPKNMKEKKDKYLKFSPKKQYFLKTIQGEITNFFKKRKQPTKLISKELRREPNSIYSFVNPVGSYFEEKQTDSQDQMESERNRFASFFKYVGDGNPNILARNGFYHDEIDGPTSTKCFRCNIQHSAWNETDDVFSVHQSIAPRCPLIAQNIDARRMNSTNAEVQPRNIRPAVSEAQRYINHGVSREYGIQETNDTQMVTSGTPGSANQTQQNGHGASLQSSALPVIETSCPEFAPAHTTWQAVREPWRSGSCDTNRPVSLGFAEGGRSESVDQDTGMTTNRPGQSNQWLQEGGTSSSSGQVCTRIPRTTGRNCQYKYPDYASSENRLRSFKDWPCKTQAPEKMTEAGFFYVGFDDCVRCFDCGIGIKDWNSDDDPILEHARWRPNCEYINTLKGVDIISLVQMAVVNAERNNGQQTDTKAQVSMAREAQQGNSSVSTASTPTASADQTTEGRSPAVQGSSGHGAGGRGIPPSSIVIENPRHRDNQDIDSRIETFQGWPSHLDQTPRQMAEAGFFYLGVEDQVRCFCCDGGLGNWEPNDDPVLEHTRWFPQCQYIKKLKGERYVAAVQRKHEEHEAEQQRRENEQRRRRDENHHASDHMATDAAEVLLEMGFSADRVQAAILAVREQTGSIAVNTHQVLTWLLDEQDQQANPRSDLQACGDWKQASENLASGPVSGSPSRVTSSSQTPTVENTDDIRGTLPPTKEKKRRR